MKEIPKFLASICSDCKFASLHIDDDDKIYHLCKIDSIPDPETRICIDFAFGDSDEDMFFAEV